MQDEDQPPAPPGDDHPFNELVANGQPATLEELAEFVSGYLTALRAIVATQTNPLDAVMGLRRE
jgi:hypothetical protein